LSLFLILPMGKIEFVNRASAAQAMSRFRRRGLQPAGFEPCKCDHSPQAEATPRKSQSGPESRAS
jgi:hypothetical protein